MADDRDFPYEWSNPTPPDKVEGVKEGVKEEAKALVEKFIEYAHSDWDDYKGFDEVGRFNNAKKCALIHCQLMISKLSELLNTGLHNDFGLMDERKHYTDLKASINKL